MSKPGEPLPLPDSIDLAFEHDQTLRYGENPHQRAGLYVPEGSRGALGGAEQLQGKEMSYNNWLDTDAARAISSQFELPTVVIVKHQNPCGVATAVDDNLAEAYERARLCDETSAYGGIVSANYLVDRETAEAISKIFTEVVIAPGYTKEARRILSEKDSLRVLLAPGQRVPAADDLEYRSIDGAVLVQNPDWVTEAAREERIPGAESVTGVEPTNQQWLDLIFAWRVAGRVKSNAILLAKDETTVGVGPGQPNRLDSVAIAVERAGDQAKGSVLASDAFFPFADGVEKAIEAGVSAIIQPGGSKRDPEVVVAAKKAGIPMIFTGTRHFRH